MEYTVKVVLKQEEISDKEKTERIKQFQDAFVVAAVDYYSNVDKLTNKKNKNSVA